MALLYPRIGRWSVTIRSEPPAGSRGGIDIGTVNIERGPGGFSIVQTFHSKGASGEIRGQSYTWWDRPTRSYRSVWCDNQQGCVEFTTSIHGNRWTVELESRSNGRKVHTSIVATMSDDHNTIREETLNSYNDGPARREATSLYRRILPSTGEPRGRRPRHRS